MKVVLYIKEIVGSLITWTVSEVQWNFTVGDQIKHSESCHL